MLQEEIEILKGERFWINKIKSALLNGSVLDEYSKWLKPYDDKRGRFVEDFKNSLASQFSIKLPNGENYSEEWLEMIGYNLSIQIEKNNGFKNINKLLSLARPALRMEMGPAENLVVGASKIGGLPDLPKNISWPLGEDCDIIFDASTEDIKEPAGFLCQINLNEIAEFKTHNNLPTKGLLSFFCYQDEEDIEIIGVKCFYFENLAELERQAQPKDLSEANQVINEQKINLIETYDFPGTYDGPWSEEIESNFKHLEDLFYHYRNLNFENMMGYGRSTTGGDPTESKEDQHLIILENAYESRVHVQIPIDQLANKNFEEIKLSWVDFD